MDGKKELKILIETLKKATGKTQGQISLGAGYEEKSLTQALSKSRGHQAVIKQLRIAYKNILENPTNIDYDKVMSSIIKEQKHRRKAEALAYEDVHFKNKYLELLEKHTKNLELEKSNFNLNDVLEKLKVIELGVDEIKQFLLDPQKGTVQVVSYQKKKDK